MYKLPSHLKPYHYEIIIKPYLSLLRQPEFYEGHVVIKFKCIRDTSKIVLHKGVDLQINNDSLELVSISNAFQPVKKLSWSFDEKTELLVIDLKKVILGKNSNYSISIGFKSKLKDLSPGLYRRFYTDDMGVKRFDIAVTKALL